MYVLCQGGPGLPQTVMVLKNMNVGSPKNSCQYFGQPGMSPVVLPDLWTWDFSSQAW